MLRIASLALLVCLCSGCATPSRKFAITADRFGLRQDAIQGEPFFHRLFVNLAAQQHGTNNVLHVYIDGDGTPWENGRWPANDPTSRNPLILKLLRDDRAPAILLGRPCYHGFNTGNACRPKFWTSHRYSPQVVTSMSAALQHWLNEHPFRQVALIGFSGGGTLSVLMARDTAAVDTVVTIAANLDTAAWTSKHGYRPLTGSLNPMKMPPLPAKIRQLHYVGLLDRNIPAESVKKFSTRQHNAAFVAFPEFGHLCCWETIWSRILAELPAG